MTATEPPRVSIVCGTYNARSFIDDMLTSVKAQTCGDWECIFVDDGSKDGTPEYLRQLAATDPRFVVVAKVPEGSPARSRNAGIALARGHYIAFCDHDDFWAPDKLERQLRAFELFPEAGLVHTGRIEWSTPGLPQQFLRSARRDDSIKVQSTQEALYGGCRITQSSVMVAKDKLTAIGALNPDLRGVDDYHAFLKLSLLGPIVRIDEDLTYYRWHASNLSHVDGLFIEGLRKMAIVMERENLPKRLLRTVLAQADKSEAVLLLVRSPLRAVALLVRSLRVYALPQTWAVLGVAVLCLVLPQRWRLKMVRSLRGANAVGQM